MKNIFYLKEIEGSIDSAMSLQVINDYGHLSKTNKIFIPINYTKKSTLKEYIKQNFNNPNFKIINFKRKIFQYKYLRRISLFFHLLKNIHKLDIIVIREKKHLNFVKIIKKCFNIAIVSELHEGGLPLSSSHPNKNFQEYLNCLDGVVLTTTAQLKYLENHKYKLPKNICTLPNGVSIENFSKAKNSTNNKKEFILTYTGQFTSWKNIPLLFKALSYLPKNYKLRLAGGKIKGSSKDYINSLIEKYNLQKERVEYLGFIQPDLLVEKALNGSSILLVPLGDNPIAKYATSPMKLVEYMATNIPIVAVNHPSVLALASPEAISLSTTNPKDFATTIIETINKDENAKLQSIKQANILAKKYSHENRALTYDKWLSEISS